MKNLFFPIALVVAATVFSIYSCTQQEVAEETLKIENTLKSVSFWQDSAKIEPEEIWALLEKVNNTIDSIGYPDSGYQLWIVQADTLDEYRFLINGLWPNQEIYDEIHNHELYQSSTKGWEELMNMIKFVKYDRFVRYK
jgi:hypothetical protein